MALQHIDLQKTRFIRLQTCKGAGLRYSLGRWQVQAAGLRDKWKVTVRAEDRLRGLMWRWECAGPPMIMTSFCLRPCEIPPQWSVWVQIHVWAPLCCTPSHACAPAHLFCLMGFGDFLFATIAAVVDCLLRVFLWTSSFISREGNGTPLQYSCLENPMDRGAW